MGDRAHGYRLPRVRVRRGGRWKGARWGHRLAIGILVVNLFGDATSAIMRSDPRTLIGLPIGGAMIAYLLTRRVRNYFTNLTDGAQN